MSREIHIQPITRIEGHASIQIQLNEAGEVQNARVNIMSLRGFEKFIEGKPADEVPRIVSRICGICPWMHHLASTKAVDRCFGVTPPQPRKNFGNSCKPSPTRKTNCCTFSFWPPRISSSVPTPTIQCAT